MLYTFYGNKFFFNVVSAQTSLGDTEFSNLNAGAKKINK